MAYNFPNYYYQQQPMQQQGMQQQTMQGGFVSVQSEEQARNYPVAPGNSITFMDENSPYVYTKTMGFNQLDRPMFKKYKLVEEQNSTENQAQNTKAENMTAEKQNAEIEQIWREIDAIKKDIKNIRNQRPRKTIRKEGEKDE